VNQREDIPTSFRSKWRVCALASTSKQLQSPDLQQAAFEYGKRLERERILLAVRLKVLIALSMPPSGLLISCATPAAQTTKRREAVEAMTCCCSCSFP